MDLKVTNKIQRNLLPISNAITYSVYRECPPNFSPKFEAVGCFFEYEDKVLLLKRHPQKVEGNKWGIPGGKIDEGESPKAAIIRESFEEMGWNIGNDEKLEQMGRHYIYLPATSLIFHMFRLRLLMQPPIKLQPTEHQEAQWLTVPQALELDLMMAEAESFMSYNEIINCRN